MIFYYIILYYIYMGVFLKWWIPKSPWGFNTKSWPNDLDDLRVPPFWETFIYSIPVVPHKAVAEVSIH